MSNKKLVLLTGAAGELGQAVALTLVNQGYHVLLVDLFSQIELLQNLEAKIISTGGYANVMTCDVSEPDDVKRLYNQTREVGVVSVLVNNAGINRPFTLLRTPKADWDRVLAVNLTGPFLMMQTFARDMMKQRYGRIVNVAAVIGQMGFPAAIPYGASKSGLIGLTRVAASELASYNVCCNAVVPGFLDTSFLNDLPIEWKDEIVKKIPVGRMGTSEEVAEVVAFLASEKASYVAGTIYNVSGGLLP